ncbi:MAG: cell division protein FtsQ/DivIB [Betaproteobacteria bacterium AqS2]|uniref:Cell division protein FtsQ/DivIB n=1 Tax=Candidatus Amphirhobacter heronislandensis TaxID=1732024 RepID=A0A930UGB2_9GAMM|nr:cell division protein FtsQ/DivIB [Betaproteobacteria bacterium AqS2]
MNAATLRHLLAGAALLLLLAVYSTAGPLFHLYEVRITGDAWAVDERAVREGLRQAGPMSLVRGDFDALAAHLAAQPLVKSAELGFDYPHRLAVAVTARDPVARSVDGGLIDVNGQWYAADHAGSLPLFDMDRRRMPRGAALLLAAGPRLAEAGLGATQLHHGADGWRLFLSNGWVLLLGEERIHRRFDRFLRALPELRVAFAAGYGNLRFDLRYPHGMAVAGARGALGGDQDG